MNLINKVEQLSINKQYVRIRTDYGSNFETFFEMVLLQLDTII